MNEFLALLGLILLVVIVFRLSVWLIGIDRAAKVFPGKREVVTTGSWGVLYVNGETREGWVRMLNWRFSIEGGVLFINPAPQIPLLWLLPPLAIPLSEMTEIYSPGAWFSGGWRKAYLVQRAGIKIRLPEEVSAQIKLELNRLTSRQ